MMEGLLGFYLNKRKCPLEDMGTGPHFNRKNMDSIFVCVHCEFLYYIKGIQSISDSGSEFKRDGFRHQLYKLLLKQWNREKSPGKHRDQQRLK